MSVCGHPDEENASAAEEAPVPREVDAKSSSTAVRVFTVLAYLLSVSMAAILLSFYYICMWKSPELPPLNETELGPSARRDPGPALDPSPALDTGRPALDPGSTLGPGRPALDRLHHQHHHTHAGGSNISMNESASVEPFGNATSTPEDVPSEETPSIEPGPSSSEEYDLNHSTTDLPPDRTDNAT